MQITRRNFLQTAGTTMAAILSTGALNSFGQRSSDELFPLPPEVYSQGIYSMTFKQFEGLRGTTFSLTVSGGRTVLLTLTEVNRLERQQNTLGGYYGECYSLIFETMQRLKLPQGVYPMSGGGHDLGSVLLVPTGIGQRQYELIVNRLTR